jgi:nonribosomal peptide synthetase DhbF
MLTPVALSYGQRRLWALDKLEGPSATYNIPIAFRIHGKIDVGALQNAVTRVVSKHETLRTIIIENESANAEGFLLEISNSSPILYVTKLYELAVNERLSSARGLIEQDIARPFLINQDFAVRANLYLLDNEESILSFVLHHHAADGISLALLTSDLSKAYQLEINKSSVDLDELPIQYSDWADWQEETLQKNLKSKVERACKRLGNLPDSLNLPLDQTRLDDRFRRADFIDLTISASVTQKLERLAQQQNTTLFAVLLAAYGYLLSRLTNQTDLVIGTPVSGRDQVEVEELIGLFVNTLALPISIDPTSTVADLINHARESVQSALTDHDLPFEKLVEELGVERSLSQTPVFQTMLSFQTQGSPVLMLAGVSTTPEPVRMLKAKFDLTLLLTPETSGEIKGGFEFDSDLFDRKSVESWTIAFENILFSITNPNELVGNLPLISQVEKEKLLARGRGSKFHETLTEFCLTDLFEQQISRSPNSIAILFEDNESNPSFTTYKDLDRFSNQLARQLISRGIGPEDRVGILLERGIELIVSILGILKAGAAYVPIDPDYPITRINYTIEDSQAGLLITSFEIHQKLLDQIESPAFVNPILLSTESFSGSGLTYSDKPIQNDERVYPLTSQNLAYVIYTSGSTGKPKGVAITHHNVVRLMERTQTEFYFDETDVWSLFHSTAFDFSVWEIWGALAFGGKLLIVPDNIRRSTPEFLALIRKYGVTVLNQTPSAFDVLAAEEATIQSTAAVPLALKTVIFWRRSS